MTQSGPFRSSQRGGHFIQFSRNHLRKIGVFVFCVFFSGQVIGEGPTSGVTHNHCADCDSEQLDRLWLFLAKQVENVSNSTGSIGNVAVIRDGEIVRIGIASLYGTGNLVTTDLHIIFRKPSEHNRGKIERTLRDPIAPNFERTTRGSDNGKIYFESVYHTGKHNLVEIDVESFRTSCIDLNTDSTLQCDAVEIRLKEDVFRKFNDPNLYAVLLGPTTGHDEIHGSNSLLFVSGIGAVWKFGNCPGLNGLHPSQFNRLHRQVFFHNCPSKNGLSGMQLQFIDKEHKRRIVGLHTSGSENFSMKTDSGQNILVATPKIGIALTTDRVHMMQKLFFEEIDRRGIDVDDPNTWSNY